MWRGFLQHPKTWRQEEFLGYYETKGITIGWVSVNPESWGADLVVGHHPHVLQGIEEYQGKYIVYDYCPTPQTGDAAQKIIDRLNKYSKEFNITIEENGVIQ